ncbi:hypothetical protein ACFST9_04260 [Hymenobacter monticola]|uniref:Trimeric autotransporter adhesin YadA-like head domain-containing protein n=1 Tax=Hymenobacter monticola TaxID=1705399 RepID=A0ABY4B126_9BACT|nr:hypothetical protein [Hymenobacter monticola]UOE32832.1 hypothetical protein MTP16_17060 [Hymenobacter monticola]
MKETKTSISNRTVRVDLPVAVDSTDKLALVYDENTDQLALAPTAPPADAIEDFTLVRDSFIPGFDSSYTGLKPGDTVTAMDSRIIKVGADDYGGYVRFTNVGSSLTIGFFGKTLNVSIYDEPVGGFQVTKDGEAPYYVPYQNRVAFVTQSIVFDTADYHTVKLEVVNTAISTQSIVIPALQPGDAVEVNRAILELVTSDQTFDVDVSEFTNTPVIQNILTAHSTSVVPSAAAVYNTIMYTLGSAANSIVPLRGDNQSFDPWSAVAGGRSNKAGYPYAFVGGGYNNSGIGQYAVVVGGDSNLTDGAANFIGAGVSNRTGASYSAVVGGTSNRAGQNHSFVGAGANNTVEGEKSAVVTGYFNKTQGSHAIIGAGYGNNLTSTANYGIIGGGYYNTNSADRGFIGGGEINTITGYAATIPGGSNNTAGGAFSIIGGGYLNTIAGGADYVAILGGRSNVINSGALDSSIVGGSINTVNGVNNHIHASYDCVIPASCTNVLAINCTGFTVPENTSNATFISNQLYTPGTSVTIEQNLSSNSTTAVLSVNGVGQALFNATYDLASFGYVDLKTNDKTTFDYVDNELDLKAPLFSPAFGGNPTTPTPSPSAFGQQVVNASWVRTITNSIGSAYTNYHSINPVTPGQNGGLQGTKETVVNFLNSDNYAIYTDNLVTNDICVFLMDYTRSANTVLTCRSSSNPNGTINGMSSVSLLPGSMIMVQLMADRNLRVLQYHKNQF